jgi:hypothetical protein
MDIKPLNDFDIYTQIEMDMIDNNKYILNDPKFINTLLIFIDNKIRLVDWFIEIHSRIFNIFINEFNIYHEYQSELNNYGSKKYFDPFCRKCKLIIRTDQNIELVTSIGQLNFFIWAFNNNITKYIIDNLLILESLRKHYYI